MSVSPQMGSSHMEGGGRGLFRFMGVRRRDPAILVPATVRLKPVSWSFVVAMVKKRLCISAWARS